MSLGHLLKKKKITILSNFSFFFLIYNVNRGSWNLRQRSSKSTLLTQSRRHECAKPKFYASTLSLSQFGTNAIFSLVPFGDDKSDLDKKKNVAIDSNSSVSLQMPRLHKKKKLLIYFNFNIRLTNIIFVNLFYYLTYFYYYL